VEEGTCETCGNRCNSLCDECKFYDGVECHQQADECRECTCGQNWIPERIENKEIKLVFSKRKEFSMAIKKMQINIEINTKCDSPNQVKELILALMSEAGDRTFAIDSVTIDGVENFRLGTGFVNDLAKKQIN